MRDVRITILVMVMAAILCINTNLLATPVDITFTEDGFIQDGDDYNWVYVYGDTTTVSMTGGGVENLLSYNSSTTNISGGEVSYAQIRDQSTNNFSDGIMRNLWSYNSSTTNISGGYVANALTYDQSTINISGGFLNDLNAYDGIINVTGGEVGNVMVGLGGVFNISGGQITGQGIYVTHSGVANIYGYGFDYNKSRDPQLTGFWADNTPFGLTFWHPGDETYDSYDYVVLHEIPEPATLLLLGLGSMMLRKRE